MFKLLPEKIRTRVEHEYAMRLGVAILTGLLFAIVVGIVGLLPSYLLFNIEERRMQDEIIAIGGLEAHPEIITLRKWLSGTNLKLSLLDPSLDVDRPSTYIAKALEEKIGGIRVYTIGWSKNSGAISISGEAMDRQALLDFEKELNTSDKFAEVAIPVSNLAKTRDIAFKVELIPKTNP